MGNSVASVVDVVITHKTYKSGVKEFNESVSQTHGTVQECVVPDNWEQAQRRKRLELDYKEKAKQRKARKSKLLDQFEYHQRMRTEATSESVLACC
jgi:hypothetical protein